MLLTAQGFDTVGAFRAIREAEIEGIIDGINKFLSDLANEDSDKQLRDDIDKKLSKYFLRLKSDVKIPIGHQLLIKSIIAYSQKPSQPVIVLENLESFKEDTKTVSEESKKRKSESLDDRIVSCAKKCIDSISVKGTAVREALTILKADGYYINCCYCTQDIKVQTENGINVSGLKKHITRIHLKGDDDRVDLEFRIDDKLDSATTSSTSTSLSSISANTIDEPPNKRQALNKDENAKKKDNLIKKVCNHFIFLC